MDNTALTPTLSNAQSAYQWIKTRISDGSYGLGYRLVFGQIGRELGVGPIPVREAIRLLEFEGLVTFERNIGVHVTMIDPSEYLVTMQTLSLVEGYATALSAPEIGATTLNRARWINEEMAQILRHFDPSSFTRLNLEFHSTLFERCPNSHILDLVHKGWGRLTALRESTFSFVSGRAHESVDEHAALIDLIESGVIPLQIELAARNHRLGTLDAFLASQAEHPSRPLINTAREG